MPACKASNSDDGTSTSRYLNGVSDWNGRCDLDGDIPSLRPPLELSTDVVVTHPLVSPLSPHRLM
jgi:hypothetical protein